MTHCLIFTKKVCRVSRLNFRRDTVSPKRNLFGSKVNETSESYLHRLFFGNGFVSLLLNQDMYTKNVLSSVMQSTNNDHNPLFLFHKPVGGPNMVKIDG